jgi:hypothetical protein
MGWRNFGKLERFTSFPRSPWERTIATLCVAADRRFDGPRFLGVRRGTAFPRGAQKRGYLANS